MNTTSPLRVLFIGNSQVNCVCDIAAIVDALSRSAPAGVRPVQTDEVVVGGATLEILWNDGRPLATIEAGGWDWVVANEIIYSYGGMAWLKAWELRPDLDFHRTDRAHPNAPGYYLNACVIFAALTDSTPVGLDPFTLPKDEAAFLQSIAWQQHHDDRRNEKGPGLL